MRIAEGYIMVFIWRSYLENSRSYARFPVPLLVQKMAWLFHVLVGLFAFWGLNFRVRWKPFSVPCSLLTRAVRNRVDLSSQSKTRNRWTPFCFRGFWRFRVNGVSFGARSPIFFSNRHRSPSAIWKCDHLSAGSNNPCLRSLTCM